MKLYCRSGFVCATHGDEQEIPASAYDAVMPDESIDPAYIIAVPDQFAVNASDPEPEITPELLTATKQLARRRVALEADKLANTITGEIPRSERDSWGTKAAAADARIAGNATLRQTAMLQAEAEMRGITIDALADMILERAAVYEVVAAKIAAQRSLTFEAVDSAPTISDIETALTAAKAAANSILQDLQTGP